MNRFRSYIICTSPRSGSTLLCKLLNGTGKAGNPESHFHTPSLEKWLFDFELLREQFASDRDAVKAVVAAAYRFGTGETDVFGLRMQRHSFDFFLQQLKVLHPDFHDGPSRIQAAFGDTLFIHLSREDKLEQAVSYVKASQSGLWHIAADGSELERLSAPKEPEYDAKAIAHQLSLLVKMDKDWDAWFTQAGIKPLRMTYSELCSGPKASLARILENLGVAYNLNDAITLPVAKLADATNANWVKRFTDETKGL